MAKFRTCSHDLEVERGRHTDIPRDERLCKSCGRYIRGKIFSVKLSSIQIT